MARNAIQSHQTSNFGLYCNYRGLFCQLGNHHPFHCLWHASLHTSTLSQSNSKVSFKLCFSRLEKSPCIFLIRSYRGGFYRGISCPYAHFINFLSTRRDKEYGLTLKEMCIRVICQVFGGLWAYKLNQAAWNFYLTPMHWYQSYNTSYGICLTFLNVSTSYGFLIGKIIKENAVCQLLQYGFAFLLP